MVHAGTLYKSGDFIATMKSITDIDPEACDELAKEIVRKQPGLRSAKKSAAGVLSYLQGHDKKKDGGGVKLAPVLDVASHLAKTDVDNEEDPPRWDVLQQAGDVPPWPLVAEAAINVCKKCELRDIASAQMCSACTAAQMLAGMAVLPQNSGKDGE